MLNLIRRLRHGGVPILATENGQALLFVLIAVALLMTIPIAIATTTVNQLPETSRNLNWDAAYEAAQAGLNDYMQHLDVNNQYTQYNKTNPDGNTAFTGWVQASTSPLEYYSYAPTSEVGQILLTVSGMAGGTPTKQSSGTVVRTFSFTVRPDTSLNDVYWSNYETLDPNVTGGSGDQAYCATYYDEPFSQSFPSVAASAHLSGSNYTIGSGSNAVTVPAVGPPSDCVVQFFAGDDLNGPVYSNDTFRMCENPEFDSSVTSGNTFAPSKVTNPQYSGEGTVWVDSCVGSGTDPDFAGPPPAKVGNTTPATTSNDATPAQSYGCYYSAPSGVTIAMSLSGTTTQIVITPVSGTVTVTKLTGNTSSCSSSTSFTTAQTILLKNMETGLIYVNGGAINVSGEMQGLLDIVDGTGNINVTGNVYYPSANINSTTETDATDALGLIANNSVIVSEVDNITIDAAILAVNDSFYVNNWTTGSGGPHGNGYYDNLNVFGAIAQNFRGPVGTFGTSHGVTVETGFSKNYQYDESLQSLWPPYFLPPGGAVWNPSAYSELCAGYTYSVLGTKTPGSC